MVVEDALSRIDSILEMQPLKETEKKEIPADTSITFENVSFRYKGASKDEILSHEVQDGTTMMENGVERISSNDLSKRMKVTASQIRQDLDDI